MCAWLCGSECRKTGKLIYWKNCIHRTNHRKTEKVKRSIGAVHNFSVRNKNVPFEKYARVQPWIQLEFSAPCAIGLFHVAEGEAVNV